MSVTGTPATVSAAQLQSDAITQIANVSTLIRNAIQEAIPSKNILLLI